MSIFSKIKNLLAKPYVKPVLVVLVALIIAIMIRSNKTVELEPEVETVNPLVTLTSAVDYAGADSLSLIGTVRAFTEANITAETGGQVTSVNVKLGDIVSAGQIIATIENASERAFVLQAEGSYDAAKVAAAQSDIGVREAEASLADAVRAVAITSNSAYGTTFGVLNNTIDQYYSGANTAYPGVRVSTGETTFLRNERITLQNTLEQWYEQQNSNVPNSTLFANLSFAKGEVERLLKLNDVILQALSSKRSDGSLDKSVLESQKAELTVTRSQLIGAKNSLESASSNLKSAEEGLSRAELASSGGSTSLADAQLKQALGSLRAAQANLAKTILRSPIRGAVNSLSIKSGDFIGSFTTAAVVANNEALEIVTFVGDRERQTLAIGDTIVIDGNYEGTITQISPAVDSATRKTEVRIAAENKNIKNGDTVKITKKVNKEEVSTMQNITVPLTSVKFEIADGFMFIVVDGVLETRPVTLGTVRAGSVVITSGLSADEMFVEDARGLLAGQAVEVKN